MGSFGDCWVCLRDLNVVMDQSENMGEDTIRPFDGHHFREFLETVGGIDLGCFRSLFTWRNGRDVTTHIQE